MSAPGIIFNKTGCSFRLCSPGRFAFHQSAHGTSKVNYAIAVDKRNDIRIEVVPVYLCFRDDDRHTQHHELEALRAECLVSKSIASFWDNTQISILADNRNLSKRAR